MTTILDLVGAGLIIGAAFIIGGLAAALIAGGSACLLASWSMSHGGDS